MRAEIGNGKGLTIAELIEYSGAKPVGITTGMLREYVTAFALDSREVSEGTMFIALKGERVDGHNYIKKAHENGAVLTLAEREIPDCTLPMLVSCDGSEAALGRIAAAYRARFSLKSAAVTGSVGKTTTKEMINAVLSAKYPTHKTEGNFNSTTGVPMSLMTLNDSYEAAVWEMGMSARGEIESMSLTAKPDVGVITNIGISHIEMLGSRENIRDAKLEIRAGMPDGGVLILNGDEPLLSGIDGARYVSLDNKDADYHAENIVTGIGTVSFDVVSRISGTTHINLPITGSHNILDAMLAFAAGEALGVPIELIAHGLNNYRTIALRQNVYTMNGCTVIEDCYNAAPDSMKAALNVLDEIGRAQSGRRIAVIGDMRELGTYTEPMHREIGKYAADKADIIFTFGTDSLLYAEEAEKSDIKRENIASFTDINDIAPITEALKNLLRPGDTVLFKASHSLALERVIEALK